MPIGDKEVDEGTPLTFTVEVTDPAVQVLLADHNLPSAPSFVDRVFTWTPSYSHAGSYECTFNAAYGLLEDSETITVKVNNVNRPPVIAPLPAQTVAAGQMIAFTITASDPDGNAVMCTASSLPSGATFAADRFSWTPSSSQTGTYNITFTATDGQLTSTQTAVITVTSGANTVVIIDNSTANCSSSGWWGVSGAAGCYGADSLWGRDGAAYTWTFKPTVSGTYDVAMWWTYHVNRPASLPVSIQNAVARVVVYVNQLQNGSKWNSLGKYKFNAGTAYRITITAPPVSSTNADAVKFTLQP